MKKQYFLLFFLTVFFWSKSFAQSSDTDKSKAATFKYTKQKVINDEVTYKNAFKVGVLGPVFGYVPFYYERKITKMFIVEVGSGLSTRDWVQEFSAVFLPRENNTNIPSVQVSDDVFYNRETFNRNVKYKLGYALFVEPKINYLKGGLDGGYVGLSINYARHNMESQDKFAEWHKENVQTIGTQVTLGYSVVTKRFIVDFGTGIGFRKLFHNRFYSDDQYTGMIEFDNFRGNYTIYVKLGSVFGQ